MNEIYEFEKESKDEVNKLERMLEICESSLSIERFCREKSGKGERELIDLIIFGSVGFL
jgi:hypothetical protein